LSKLAKFCVRRRRLVVLFWIVALVGSGAAAAKFPAVYSNEINIPGSEAQKATNVLVKRFPSQSGDTDQIVIHALKGKVTDPAVIAQVQPMLTKVAGLPHVAGVISPWSAAGRARGQVSKQGKIAFATVSFDERAQKLPVSASKRVVRTARSASNDQVQIELGGQAISNSERESPGASEAIGLLAAIVILLFTFGSVVAAGLPIITALVALGTGLSLLALVSRGLDTADFAPQLASMLGIGVGIDYVLFIVSRFRDAWAHDGGQHEKSIVTAMETAGRSVLFAGVTVVIAILGLVLLGIKFLYGVSLSTAMVVTVTMLASLTLTPALLAFDSIGGRIGRRRTQRKGADKEGQIWARWSDAVVRHRWICAIGGTLVLVALTIPAFTMRQLHNDAGNDRTFQTTRKAYDLLAEGFGPGFNGPISIVAELPAGSSAQAIGKIAATVKDTPGVVAVTPPKVSTAGAGAAGSTALLTAYSATSPQSSQTTDLVNRLRSQVAPELERETGATVLVGGFTPATIDLANLFSRKLPLFIAVVVLLSALLLMAVFRSILVPIKAAVMNLLSIGAALGVVTLVFQYGWGASLLGVEPGPIEPFLPVMMFAIVFGLSMDYEVFIVSRIREEWVRTGDPRGSVRTGLAATGRVVTAAALIMVLVFASFMLGGEKTISMFGLGLATAVFLDAFLIRVILLPAVMDLAANATWWLPGWLDRLLPKIPIESASED
jgi:RND superfamily putative drug exporter